MKVFVKVCPQTKQLYLRQRALGPDGTYGYGLKAGATEEETKQIVKDWIKAHREWDVICY